MFSGFLVVLQDRGTQFGPGANPRYRGIYRMPMWPSQNVGENPLLERLVFELANDHGLIDDLNVARDLAAGLAQFGRSFEIIHCELVTAASPTPRRQRPTRSS